MTQIQKFDPNIAASIADLARRIMNVNLCDEIVLSPAQLCIIGYPKTTVSLKKLMPKYQFSRAKWYEARLPRNEQTHAAYSWCVKQFGPEPKNTDAWSRWYFNVDRIFRFRDEKDYHWFILRWGV
jgi:hypothetical protein